MSARKLLPLLVLPVILAACGAGSPTAPRATGAPRHSSAPAATPADSVQAAEAAASGGLMFGSGT